MSNYADILETYIIAEESIFEDVWKELDPFSKIGLVTMGAGTAVYQGTKLFNRFRQKRVSDKREIENEQPKRRSKESEYYKNTVAVITKLREEHSEAIEKEMKLRRTELKKFITFINRLSKKYHAQYFEVSSEWLVQYLNCKEDDDMWYDTNYLNPEVLLPSYGPKMAYRDVEEIYYYDNNLTLTVCTGNIHDWNDAVNDGKASVRDYEETKEYHDMINGVMNAIDNECKRYKTLARSVYGGDWDDCIIDIAFKPSDEFMNLAKRYGWYE